MFIGPGILRRTVNGADHNRTLTSTVASEKCVGHPSGNTDRHTNTTGGSKADEFVLDSLTVPVTALSSKDKFALEDASVPGETGSGGETRVANLRE